MPTKLPTKRKTGPFDVPLTRVVTRRLATLANDRPMAELHRLFDDPKNEHVVVIDRRGRALGVISRAELLVWPPPCPAPPLDQLTTSAFVAVPGTMSVAAASALMVRRKLEGVLFAFDDASYGCLVAADVVRFVAQLATRHG